MKYLSLLLAASTCLTFTLSKAAAQASPDLLTQVQAADVLSDLTTYVSDRTGASAQAMQAFLQQIGKADDYAKNKPIINEPARMDFVTVFKSAVLFMKTNGDKYADPTLKNLNESQLLSKLTELQTYNIQQFIHLNQQRRECDSMRAYLESINEFDHYLKSSGQPAPPADQPPPTTPEQMAARMDALINYAKAVEWKKAQAQGVSQSDFETQWRANLAKYHETIAQKVEGLRALGTTLGQTERAGNTPPPPAVEYQTPSLGPIPPPAIWTAPPPPQPAARELPPTVQSTHTNANIRALDRQNYWNPWDNEWYDDGVPIGR
jgi:hypothetical protein